MFNNGKIVLWLQFSSIVDIHSVIVNEMHPYRMSSWCNISVIISMCCLDMENSSMNRNCENRHGCLGLITIGYYWCHTARCIEQWFIIGFHSRSIRYDWIGFQINPIIILSFLCIQSIDVPPARFSLTRNPEQACRVDNSPQILHTFVCTNEILACHKLPHAIS